MIISIHFLSTKSLCSIILTSFDCTVESHALHFVNCTTAKVLPEMETYYPWSYVLNKHSKYSYKDTTISIHPSCLQGWVCKRLQLLNRGCPLYGWRHRILHVHMQYNYCHITTGTHPLILLLKIDRWMLWTTCAVVSSCQQARYVLVHCVLVII